MGKPMSKGKLASPSAKKQAKQNATMFKTLKSQGYSDKAALNIVNPTGDAPKGTQHKS